MYQSKTKGLNWRDRHTKNIQDTDRFYFPKTEELSTAPSHGHNPSPAQPRRNNEQTRPFPRPPPAHAVPPLPSAGRRRCRRWRWGRGSRRPRDPTPAAQLSAQASGRFFRIPRGSGYELITPTALRFPQPRATDFQHGLAFSKAAKI